MKGEKTIKNLVKHSISSYVSALDEYNRIGTTCRIEGFAFFITNAWELLLKARMIQLTGKVSFIYYKRTRGEKRLTKSIDDCIGFVFQDELNPVRKNIEWISELRNEAVHYFVSELESTYISYFQASAVNYANAIYEWFDIDLNKKYDFPILSLFSSSVDKIIDYKMLKYKYDQSMVEYIINQQKKDEINKASMIDNSRAQFYIPIEYKVAIVKNTDGADMLFSTGKNDMARIVFAEVPKDCEKTHPYLYSDIKKILNDKFSERVFPTKVFQTHDAICVTYVNHFIDNHQYVHRQNKPVLWRYSERYLQFIIYEIEKDEKFLYRMREKYKKMKK